MDKQQPDPPRDSPLPPWLVASLAVLLAVLMTVNIVASIVSKYQGLPVTYLLGAMLSGLLGLSKIFSGGGR